MPRRWSLGADRILSDELDGDCDRNKKTAQAHSRHDTDRDVNPSRLGGSSGPSNESASTPQKKGWRR